MLGDGYMVKKGPKAYRFELEQADFHQAWVYQTKRELNLTDTKVTTRYKRATNSKDPNAKTLCYRFGSNSINYKPIWEDFYLLKEDFIEKYAYFGKANKYQAKRIPDDLKLNGTVLYHWYMGDGTLYGNSRPTLCTDGYAMDDLAKVVLPELLRLGIKAELKFLKKPSYTEGINGYRVVVDKESAATFFNLIGPCTTKGFDHKWSKQ